MLPCVFWRLSFCLKWKFRVFEGLQWIGRPVGSQAVICTPVIWSMVIIAVCVCVCVCSIMKWQFKQTHNVVNQKKKGFFSDHIFFFFWWNTLRIWFFFSLHFLFSPLIGSPHLSLSFFPFLLSSPPLPPPLHPYISPLRSFIPATRAEKPCCHAPSVLRGSNFRFVSDFRLMSVFWLVV